MIKKVHHHIKMFSAKWKKEFAAMTRRTDRYFALLTLGTLIMMLIMWWVTIQQIIEKTK